MLSWVPRKTFSQGSHLAQMRAHAVGRAFSDAQRTTTEDHRRAQSRVDAHHADLDSLAHETHIFVQFQDRNIHGAKARRLVQGGLWTLERARYALSTALLALRSDNGHAVRIQRLLEVVMINCAGSVARRTPYPPLTTGVAATYNNPGIALWRKYDGLLARLRSRCACERSTLYAKRPQICPRNINATLSSAGSAI